MSCSARSKINVSCTAVCRASMAAGSACRSSSANVCCACLKALLAVACPERAGSKFAPMGLVFSFALTSARSLETGWTRCKLSRCLWVPPQWRPVPPTRRASPVFPRSVAILPRDALPILCCGWGLTSGFARAYRSCNSWNQQHRTRFESVWEEREADYEASTKRSASLYSVSATRKGARLAYIRDLRPHRGFRHSTWPDYSGFSGYSSWCEMEVPSGPLHHFGADVLEITVRGPLVAGFSVHSSHTPPGSCAPQSAAAHATPK